MVAKALSHVHLRWDLWHLPYDTWGWSQAREQARSHAPHTFELKPGTHTLTIHSREPLCRLDRVVLTTNPYPDDFEE